MFELFRRVLILASSSLCFATCCIAHASDINTSASNSSITSSPAANNSSASGPVEYRYWDLGASPARDLYQYKLLELALEKSKEKYGDYKLVKINEKFTSVRATREVSRGEIINIEASPYKVSLKPGTSYSEANLITVDISILKNLLGYRQLVVRKDKLDTFKHISEAKLKNMIAGQAQDWSDVKIYRTNGYKVDDNANLNNLLAMLVAGRVDYVPLSIVEADSVISKFPKYGDQLVIVPGLLLYYPFPVHFNVGANMPALAERLHYGLDLVKKDGSLDKLFNEFFADMSAVMQNPHTVIYRLNNPNLPNNEK